MESTPHAPSSPRSFHAILVTGGAGFIGSHVIRRLLQTHAELKVVNLDALTYAGNLANLADVESDPRYTFVKGDIRDAELVGSLFDTHRFDAVLHLAAESHVDRSIANPLAFSGNQHPGHRDASQRRQTSVDGKRLHGRGAVLPREHRRGLRLVG